MEGSKRPQTATCRALQWQHDEVDGEEVLRSLAEDCKREVASAPPGREESAILYARSFLTGAMIALARAKAFTEVNPQEFLEELLAPIEQPLVDQGRLERVSFGFEATASATAHPDEETDR